MRNLLLLMIQTLRIPIGKRTYAAPFADSFK
jgi:hypothetical protein